MTTLTDKHRLTISCDCKVCIDRHWGACTATYTMPTKYRCISAMKRAGWTFNGTRHIAPGHEG